MKVIDLLNKIANGEEVPKIILFNSYKYQFDKIDNVYRRLNGNSTLGAIVELDIYLNDEVEIIEEDKKIKKLDQTLNRLDINDDYYRYIMENRFKINEIIDKINKEGKW